MFRNRRDAGQQLARRLSWLRDTNPLIVGLPRGGVPVAYEVARALGAELDVIIVRKLGLPSQPEVAMGAIGEDGVRVLNQDVLDSAQVHTSELARVETLEKLELERRRVRFRAARTRVPLTGRTVVIVDDGIATGATARAACAVARAEGADRTILVVPVAPVGWEQRFSDLADELYCLHTPDHFRGVGQFYQEFDATRDEEVVRLLDLAPKTELYANEGRDEDMTAGAPTN